MRKRLFYFLALILFSSTPLTPSNAQQAFCQDFETGFQGWEGVFATLIRTENSGGYFLEVFDNSFPIESFAVNTFLDHTMIGCGEISYTYKLIDDGYPESTEPVTRQLHLVSDNNSTGNQLTAVFILDEPIFDNTGIIHQITIPMFPIQPGDPLPSNEFGSWTMSNPENWNILFSTFNEVAFSSDVAGSMEDEEHFHLDDFCYTPINYPTNTNFSVETACEGIDYVVKGSGVYVLGHSYAWRLFQTTIPGATSGGVQVGNTVIGASATFDNLEAENYYYVEYTVTDLCDDETFVFTEAIPFHDIASIFHFEDASGNIQSTFCYGEEVFLNGTASYGENNYWIGLSRRPFPNTGQPYQDFEFLGWTSGLVPNLNLSAAYAAVDYYFEGGWEYKVKLAVQNNQECVNWVEQEHSFFVECCDDFINADFKLERKSVSGTDLYALEAADYDVFPNSSVQHTWTLFSSPNQDGGPYSLMDVIIGDEFYYEVAEGLCYFVIHTVESSCGTFCFGESDCINAGGDNVEKELCDLCGPIDCELLDKLCLAPENPRNVCLGVIPAIERITWGPSNSATGYVVEIIWNPSKGACCDTQLPELSIEYYTPTSYILMNTILQPQWDCFRWRVRPVCDESEGAWSDYICFDGCLDDKRLEADVAVLNPARLYPNPANDWVQVDFNEPFSGSLQLVDKMGRIIQAQEVVNTLHTSFDITELSPGLYWLISKDANGIQIYKLIKQKI